MRRALFSFCLFVVLLFTLAGASQAPAVTDDCPYCQLYGQRFRTKANLYLFQDTAEPHLMYFGLSNRSRRKPAKLPRINQTHIGHAYGTARLLDIVPAGSEFVVESATHEVQLSSGEHVGLMCRLFYKGKEVSLVNAEFIQVHTDNIHTNDVRIDDARRDNARAGPIRRPNPDIDEAVAVKLHP